jgi:hypothetical protein
LDTSHSTSFNMDELQILSPAPDFYREVLEANRASNDETSL